MPQVRKHTRKRGSKPAELKQLARLPEMRNRAVRATVEEKARVFADANLHKSIVNFLFTYYIVAPVDERACAMEFWRCYRHLLEGESVVTLPILLLDKALIVAQLERILRGEPITLEQEDRIHDHREPRDRQRVQRKQPEPHQVKEEKKGPIHIIPRRVESYRGPIRSIYVTLPSAASV
jgi:hypothetical protein